MAPARSCNKQQCKSLGHFKLKVLFVACTRSENNFLPKPNPYYTDPREMYRICSGNLNPLLNKYSEEELIGSLTHNPLEKVRALEN